MVKIALIFFATENRYIVYQFEGNIEFEKESKSVVIDPTYENSITSLQPQDKSIKKINSKIKTILAKLKKEGYKLYANKSILTSLNLIVIKGALYDETFFERLDFSISSINDLEKYENMSLRDKLLCNYTNCLLDNIEIKNKEKDMEKERLLAIKQLLGNDKLSKKEAKLLGLQDKL